MGPFAPIGLIGAAVFCWCICAYKRWFDGLIIVATFGRLFRPIKDAITSVGKSMFGNTLLVHSLTP